METKYSSYFLPTQFILSIWNIDSPALEYKINLFQDTHLQNISYQKVKFQSVSYHF